MGQSAHQSLNGLTIWELLQGGNLVIPFNQQQWFQRDWMFPGFRIRQEGTIIYIVLFTSWASLSIMTQHESVDISHKYMSLKYSLLEITDKTISPSASISASNFQQWLSALSSRRSDSEQGQFHSSHGKIPRFFFQTAFKNNRERKQGR